jgi:site-specific DNA-adenine methylase
MNDINPYVIEFHSQMKTNPDELKNNLKRLDKTEFIELRNKESYTLYDVLNLWLNSRFIYMKFNKKGRFSNSWNCDYNFNPEKINICHELYNFHNVIFFNKDYREVLQDITPNNTFVYFDPPYVNTMIDYGHSFDINVFKEYVKNLKCEWLLSFNDEIDTGEVIKDLVRKNQFSASNKKGTSHKTDRRELLIQNSCSTN